MPEFLQTVVYGNRVYDYAISMGIFIVGIICIRILKSILLKNLWKWAAKSDTEIDDMVLKMIEKSLLPVLYYGMFYIGFMSLNLHGSLRKLINVLGIILLTYLGIRTVIAVIQFAINNIWFQKEKDVGVRSKIQGLFPAIKVVIWGIGLIFLLDNLGFEINTLIAGLGIGGIAVALAAQAVLGDLFSYFCILFDRPFELGDFVILDQYLGTIEHIGIKTTRLRSLGGEQLVFSNTDLTNSRLRNYKRMYRRRIVFKFGVTYGTSLEKLKKIPGIVKDIIDNVEECTFDRAHFAAFGDFSLNFEVVYYVEVPDYTRYMDVQQVINFALKKEIEGIGAEFAFPTQTLYLEKSGADAS